MDILRKFAIGLLAMILFLSSLGMAWSDVARRTIRDREVVKQWLEESDFYETIAPAIMENIDVPTGDNGNNLPLEDKKLQDRVSTVLDEEFIRKNTGTILDSVYDYFEGKTDEPAFALNLTDIRADLAEVLGDYAADRAAKLPVCKSSPKNDDPLTLSCLPRGTSAAAIGRQAETELLKNKEFLGDSTFTADDLAGEGEENPIDSVKESNGNSARSLYQLGGYWTFIMGFVALVSTLGIIFLSRSRPMGIRRAGITLTSAAILLGVSYAFFNFAPSRLETYFSSRVSDSASAAQELISRLVDVVAADVRGILGLYAVVFLLLGVGLIIGGFVLKKRTAQPERKDELKDPEPPVDDSAPLPEKPEDTQVKSKKPKE